MLPEAEKRNLFLTGTLIIALVLGFLAFLAFVFLLEKIPNPANLTF